MCALTNHLHIINFTESLKNKNKFLDYISELFLRKRIGLWGILPFPVYMILEYDSMILLDNSISA